MTQEKSHPTCIILFQEYTCRAMTFLENLLPYKSQLGNEYKSYVTSPTETVFLILLSQLSKCSKIESKIETCYACKGSKIVSWDIT